MQYYIYNLNKLIKSEFCKPNALSFKSITKKNLPYFIGWIAVFIWLYAYFLPMGGFKFESKLYYDNVGYSSIYYYVWLIVGGMIPVVFEGKKFIPKTFYSVLISFTCFILIRFTGTTLLSKVLMLLASACIGHIFASNVFAFFVILNNTEKFYSMTLGVFFPKLLMFIKPKLYNFVSIIDAPSLIIFIIIIVLAVCSYFYKYAEEDKLLLFSSKAPIESYSLMPLVFVVLSLNDVIAPTALHQIVNISKTQIESFYFWGVFGGIASVLFLQKRFSINVFYMINISFALLEIGFVVNIISADNYVAGLISAVCFGSSYAIGFVNIYYIAGIMVKKFESVRFYRTGIILATLYYLFSFVILEILKDVEFLAPPIFIALISTFIVIIFFALSPFFIKLLYDGEWIDDIYRLDVTKCSRLDAKLKDYKLTPAETEVCKLLLGGYTMRQIAGMQSKAYATINTYCTSIYRKLNINSRAELILILQEYISK